MRFESDVNYALDPYGRPVDAAKQRRFPWALALPVAGVVVFAGVVMALFAGGDGESADGPPLLTADPAPTRVRPEQPGGIDIPHQDKQVFERLAAVEGRPMVERLLPPPEEPLPRPIVVPSTPHPAPLPELPEVAALPARAAEPPPADYPAALPPGATATVPKEEAAPAPPSAPPPLAYVPEPAYIPEPAPAPALAPAPAPAPAPVVSAPAAVPRTGGSWKVQLASVRSEAEAQAEWKRLSSRHTEALAGLSLNVTRADLGEKGVYYRVQAGSVSEESARGICAALKVLNVGCVVVRP